MFTNLPFDTNDQDDQLAGFTDRLLGGEETEMTLAEQTQELYDLQQIVLRLQRIITEPPDEAMSQRIQAKLAGEWQRVTRPALVPPGWLDGWRKLIGSRQGQGWQPVRQRQRLASLALSAAVVTLLLFSALFISPNGENLLSAARGSAALTIILVILGVSLGGLVWWLNRRN